VLDVRGGVGILSKKNTICWVARKETYVGLNATSLEPNDAAWSYTSRAEDSGYAAWYYIRRSYGTVLVLDAPRAGG
jgi:hypothetical protein